MAAAKKKLTETVFFRILLTLVLLIFVFVAAILIAYQTQGKKTSEPAPDQQETSENQFCGGFAGTPCPEGFRCKLSGDYPDASGVCIKN